MIRYSVCILVLTVLAFTACTPSASPAPLPSISASAVSPTQTVALSAIALPPLDTSRLVGGSSTLEDASQIKVWLREMTGLRAQLGPAGDELFRLVDQVETVAVQDILRQLYPSSKPKVMPAPLRPGGGSAIGSNQFLGYVAAISLLGEVSNLVRRAEYTPDEPRPVKETDKSLGDNARAHIKLTPRVTGCHAEMDIMLTLRAEGEGIVYEEKVTAKISMTICPDEAGQVPLDFTAESSISVKGVHLSMQLADHAIGHVDDEGNLASVDHDTKSGFDVPTGTNWFTGKPVNSSAVVGYQFSQVGLNAPNAQLGSVTQASGSLLSASFPPNKETVDLAAIRGPFLILLTEEMAFRKAEEKWQDNYCVEVDVPEGIETYNPLGKKIDVLENSEKPFIASVKHQFEGKALNLPVVATLTSGAVSVTPSGTKVLAPATFRYKAPEEATLGQEATVELISRSRRGIGKLTVTFETEDLYYRVDTLMGIYSNVPVKGEICDLKKPFILKVDGHNPSGGQYLGEIVFTPTGPSGGSWKHTATSCMLGGECGKVSGNSTYELVGVAEGKPLLKMNATTASSAVNGYVGTWPWPAWQIELIPDTGTCWE